MNKTSVLILGLIWYGLIKNNPFFNTKFFIAHIVVFPLTSLLIPWMVIILKQGSQIVYSNQTRTEKVGIFCVVYEDF